MSEKESKEYRANCPTLRNSKLFCCKDCYYVEKQLDNTILCNKDGVLYK